MVEGSGEISFVRIQILEIQQQSFLLAPGWAFVETEDCRKNWRVKWSGFGGDQGQLSYLHPFEKLSIFQVCKLTIFFKLLMVGYTLTTLAWTSSCALHLEGENVTRRVWFDEERYERDR